MTTIFRTKSPRSPLPASPEAVDLGCDCPTTADEGVWDVHNACPVHGRSHLDVDPDTLAEDALRAALLQAVIERDRYFGMKRVNAGRYAIVRGRLQDVRFTLNTLYLSTKEKLERVQEIVDEPISEGDVFHRMLDRYKLFMPKDAPADKVEHLLTMCDLAQDWLDRGQVDKANRWIGFIQGVLWSWGVFTIGDLRQHIGGKTP